MAAYKDKDWELGRRSEPRSDAKVFIEVEPLNEAGSVKVDALTVDVSDSGLALLTNASLPVGTPVAIDMCGSYVATGEITNNYKNGEGLKRVGLRLVEKNANWPL
jgi:hypothetical protein